MNKEQKFRAIWILWGAFLIAPLLYDIVLDRLLTSLAAGPSAPEGVRLGVSLIGAAFTLGTLALWRLGLDPRRLRNVGPSESAVAQRWMATHILVYVFAEAVSIQGFALGLLVRSRESADYFFITTVFLVAILYPRPRFLQAALGGKF